MSENEQTSAAISADRQQAIAIIEARLPLYTDIGQLNALRECISSIRNAWTPPPSHRLEVTEPYGYVVELRSHRQVVGDFFVARSRVQPYIQVARACVEHWKTIYRKDNWRFVIVPLFNQPPVQRAARPESVQAAFEVFAGKPDTGPHATAMFRYIESLEATLASFHAERSYVIGCNTGFEEAIDQAAQVAETGDFYGEFQTQGDERRAKAIASRIRALSTAKEG